jgi:hypothetical protein
MSRIVRHYRTAAFAVMLGLLLCAPVARAAGHVDLRSPDAQDAATAQDLRSPDARELSFAPAPAPSSSTGTDWSELGIGAGTAFVVLLGIGGVAVVARRRHVVAAG